MATDFVKHYAMQRMRKGRLNCFLSWKEQPVEPLMVIYAHPPANGGKGFGIQRSRLELYVTEAGLPTPTAVVKATEIAKHLGLDTTSMTVTAILDLIVKQSDGLRKMTAFPPEVMAKLDERAKAAVN